jgi:hypothetical protein
MSRTLASTWFLFWTAICCAVTVGFTTWVSDGSSGGVRALAALMGLGFGLAIVLLVAWALAEDEPQEPERSPAAAAPPVRPVQSPPPAPLEPAPAADAAASELGLRLDEGRVLRDELAPGAADARVDLWIAGVRSILEQHRPGLAGYFNALGAQPYADDRDRLDAHLRRLATIVRDLL